MTTIDFESAKKYQESRPSLKSLKTHLQYVKCCSLEWEREDHRVTKEFLHAEWIFAEKSQLLVVERKVHSKADRYRLLFPFRALLGSRFNIFNRHVGDPWNASQFDRRSFRSKTRVSSIEDCNCCVSISSPPTFNQSLRTSRRFLITQRSL